MFDEAKLGLVAGVLAVIGVAMFATPKDVKPNEPPASGTVVVASGTPR